MQLNFWHWPDHNIGKRESRRLREEHNAAMNLNAELVEALESVIAWSKEVPAPYREFPFVSNARQLIQKAKANQ